MNFNRKFLISDRCDEVFILTELISRNQERKIIPSTPTTPTHPMLSQHHHPHVSLNCILQHNITEGHVVQVLFTIFLSIGKSNLEAVLWDMMLFVIYRGCFLSLRAVFNPWTLFPETWSLFLIEQLCFHSRSGFMSKNPISYFFSEVSVSPFPKAVYLPWKPAVAVFLPWNPFIFLIAV